jgi:hypothetical protein
MLACLLLVVGQTPDVEAAVRLKLETLRFIDSLRDPATGAFAVTKGGKPNLRAVNGAVKAAKHFGRPIAEMDRLRAFVTACYDPATGAFAEEPGGKPSGPATAVGVITAVQVGVPRATVRKAMDYLKANAKTWEEVRIAGAAVEAWGVTDCPFDLAAWDAVADEAGQAAVGGPREGGAREVGSVVAFRLRLGRELPTRTQAAEFLRAGQRDDGGWAKAGEAASDLETCYRVMRALHLLKEKPEAGAVRGFLKACRNADGGYAVTPGGPSSMSGTYYAAMIEGWLR